MVLILLLLPLWRIPSTATQTPVIFADEVTAGAGETVDIAIRLRDNPGIASLKLTVTFDEALTLNSVSYNNQIGGMTMIPQHLTSPLILNWLSPTTDVAGDWTFVTLSFTVDDDALPGSYYITLTYSAEDVYNVKEEDVNFAIRDGAVTVHGNQTPTVTPSTDQVDSGNVEAGDNAIVFVPALMFISLICAVILSVDRRKNKHHTK